MVGADIFDLILVIGICGYTLSGFFSGFILKLAQLFSLIGAFWAMRAWTSLLAPHLAFISEPSWRTIAAGAIIFIGVMLAIGILARLLKKIVAFSFGGWLDKLLGGLFGLVIGVLVACIIIIILEKLFPDAEFLRNSRAIPYFDAIIARICQWLPPELASYIGK